MRKLYFFIILTFSINLLAQKNSSSIGFIENKGQIVDQKGRKNSSVKYLLNTNGLNVQLKQNGFSYDVYETEKHPKKNNKVENYSLSQIKPSLEPEYTIDYNFHRIDIDFINSNQNVKLIAEEKTKDYDNYYNVIHAPNGILEVYKFKKVTYKNIYNNIDVVFFIPEDITKPVEYNFIVNEGGKISDIQLQFSGAKTELVENKIKMKVRFGQMQETIPMSWIENGNSKELIEINYKRTGKNTYGFQSYRNMSNKKIIIDPVPIRLWGTYYGGSGFESAGSVEVDSNNNVLISGFTGSNSNIATAGTYQSNFLGGADFIAKLDTNGVRLWGSYYPFPTSTMKIDGIDNIYLTGYTLYEEPSIPSVGCFQSVKSTYNDGFLIKLNSQGFKEWGTYYGGNENDYAQSICFDSFNNVYMVGETVSTNFFSTSGAHQLNNNSNYNRSDAFIAKFNPNGQRIWGTFYGGQQSDGFFDINISDDGFIYACGTQNSITNIATPGSYQETSDGTAGGMIVKFDLNGQRIWGTYFSNSTSLFRSVIKGDNLYLVGRTINTNSIATPGSWFETLQPIPSGAVLFGTQNSFIINFNVNTQTKNWGTYFIEQIIGIAVNTNNEFYFAGYTGVNSGITTPDSYMPTKNSYSKVYLVKLGANGQRIWGTYYGGNLGEQLGFIDIDDNNDIYLFGNVNGSTTGIATADAHQTTLGSNPDTFLVKFRDCVSSTLASSNSPICIGNNLNLTASGGTNYSWTGPNGFSSTLQNPQITNATAANSGDYTCVITGTGGCDGSNTISIVVGDSSKPIPNIANLPDINGNCTVIVSTIPTATDNCSGTVTGTTTDPLTYSLPGTYTINWNYNDGNGNIETQTQNIIISPVALPTATSPQTFCIQQNATVNDIIISGTNINWYNSSTAGNLLSNATILVDGTTYYASQTINGCESLRVPVTISIQNTPIPTGNASQEFCATSSPTLSDVSVSGTAINWYANNSGTTILPNSTLLVDGTTYFATQTINGCESVGRLMINVSLINTLNANDYSQSFCDDLNDGSENINLSNYNSNFVASTSGMTFTYYSSLNGAENQLASQQLNSNYSLSVGSTIVYVRLDSTNGCHQIVNLNLSLFQKPIISIDDVMPICQATSITVNAGSGFNSYLWSTGATTQSISISNPGTYSVTVTKNYGTLICSSTKSFNVVASQVATIASIDTQDWTDTENVIIVSTTINDNFQYSLDGVNYQVSNTFSGLTSGFYTVYVKDECGIVNEDVVLLNYPKFFTPNDDGTNDYWRIKFSQYEPNLTVTIFDRYGKIMKVLNPNSVGWDGTYNGTKVISDDYWFVVKREDGREHRAHFTLKR
ncbi:T9SS type B sorting domain-containing protein [Flavobacterium sp.]|uniref:DUF7948 domain-containing protein n=1 Tax=Flavobacterium sp. TaxID=239 RepID=UPI000EE53BE3|nr:T9SS type B sorting domain-containing protein [Flavobacterium sp.]HCQ13442.1 hypothetical protein [Flavobacterium sp.]